MTYKNNEEFSNNIKRLRKEANISQTEFAKRVGAKRSAVNMWEINGCIPHDKNILKNICEEFDISLEDLLDIHPIRKKK